jgi:hypothetical protein
MNADARSDDQAVASYIAGLTSSLASIARQQGLKDLGYLLDLVHLEAETVARRRAPDREPPRGQEAPRQDSQDDPSQ